MHFTGCIGLSKMANIVGGVEDIKKGLICQINKLIENIIKPFD